MDKRSAQSYELEAKAIIHDLKGTVWYKYGQVKGGAFEYSVFRHGIGFIGKRKSMDGLLRLLRAQLPAKLNETRISNTKRF